MSDWLEDIPERALDFTKKMRHEVGGRLEIVRAVNESDRVAEKRGRAIAE